MCSVSRWKTAWAFPVLDAVHPMDAPTALSHMTSLALNATAVALHLRVRRQPQGLATLPGRRVHPHRFEEHAVRLFTDRRSMRCHQRRPASKRAACASLEYRCDGSRRKSGRPVSRSFPPPRPTRGISTSWPNSPRVSMRSSSASWPASGRPPSPRDLFLSQNTVRNHLSAIFRRFGVHSQSQLLERLKSLATCVPGRRPRQRTL